MSINDFANNLDDMANQAEQVLADIYTAALHNLDTEIHGRIFNEKKSALGQPLGSYSTKEMWASKSAFFKAGFKPMGKGENRLGQKPLSYKKYNSYTGKTTTTAYVASTGLDRKTMYLANGYKELRAVQGLPVDTVNLQYTGELMKNGFIKKIGDNTFQLVFNNSENEKKARGYEKRKGLSIFAASNDESENAKKYIGVKINQFIMGVMK